MGFCNHGTGGEQLYMLFFFFFFSRPEQNGKVCRNSSPLRSTNRQFKLFQDLTTAGPTESLYDQNGNLEIAKVKALSRTYAQAIAGVPISMIFDPNTSHFHLSYQVTKPKIFFFTGLTTAKKKKRISVDLGQRILQRPDTNLFE